MVMISLDSLGETLPIVEEAASSITRRSVEGSSSVGVSLPFVLQLKLAQNLIRELGISEREFKYTPRQLLILELANGYLSSRNFIYIESISTLIGSKEIPGSIPLKPALCLLLKQQRLLDLPIDQIKGGFITCK
jgi:hypothetical protein